MSQDVILTYTYTNISAHPFENKHIKKLIDKIIRRLSSPDPSAKIHICDPFSNNKTTRRQGTTLITNDLNPEFNATYNLEANDFGELMERENKCFNLILFDPPYSLNQLKMQYDGIGKHLEQWQSRNMWGRCKDALASCVTVGGYVISFGWHTKGFGTRRGFTKKEVHIFTNSGRDGRYDLLVTVEQKTQTSLF